ncbi:MAG: type II secretion system F family protein [Bacillota bacterium]
MIGLHISAAFTGVAIALLTADVVSSVKAWNLAPALAPRPRSLLPEGLSSVIWRVRELSEKRDPALWEEVCYSLAFHIRAGETPAQAVKGVAEEGDSFVHETLKGVSRAYDAGASLETAFASVAGRYRGELKQIASVLEMGASSGGNIPHLLCHLAEALRRRRLGRGELRSKMTEARATAALLSLLPWGIGAFTFSQDPQAARAVWRDPVGRALFVAGGLLWLTGNIAVVFMLRALLPERPRRKEREARGV